MPDPDDPTADPKRLAALRAAGLLDSPPEEVFDRLASAAAEIMKAPIGLVSLVAEDRQFFKSSTSGSGAFAAECETPLTHSLCRHAVAALEPLILPDPRAHPEFRSHPAVQELDIAAYAGIPVVLQDGSAIGTVCVLDDQPHAWDREQIDALHALARDAADLVRRKSAEMDAKAWRLATKEGLGSVPAAGSPAARGASRTSGIAILPSFLEKLEATPPLPGAASTVEAEKALAAAASLYFREIDAYVQGLGAADRDHAGDERRRASVVAAEAALFRALQAYDTRRSGAGGERFGRADAGAALKDSIAAFLDDEQERDRKSLMFRRGLTSLEEFERASKAASGAEHALRLALHDNRV